MKSIQEIKEEQDKARIQVINNFSNDPFLGYESLEESFNDCKCSPQSEALARLLNRENLFLSGPAGSGKTTVINKFVELVDAEHEGEVDIAVTASTGIAATLIDGETIHSWAGLGIDTEPFDPKNITPMMFHKARNLKSVDVLIIDEISMLPAYLFDKLDQAMRFFRKIEEPFGGVQLVLMGDFMQLPPIDKREPGLNAGFVVTSDVWKELDISYCYLDKLRRATDTKLMEVLIKMSYNKVDEKTKDLINSRIGVEPDPDKTYTTLFTTNINVDKFNKEQLDKNPNKLFSYRMTKSGDEKAVKKLLKQSNIPDVVELKKDVTVILTTNIYSPQGLLANGSIGKVIDLNNTSVLVKFNNGRVSYISRKEFSQTEDVTYYDQLAKKEMKYKRVIASVMQYPLKLGFAITVHKSQGQTFDGVVVDLRKVFASGLGYVALSRVRTLDDLIVIGISDKAYKVDEFSMKISQTVKKKALRGREKILANIDDYESILVDPVYRKFTWEYSRA